MSSTNAVVHMDVAAEEPPVFHCVYDHVPGEFAIKVASGDVIVYIAGTFSQLRDWASNFISAAVDGRAAVEAARPKFELVPEEDIDE
jgi:hypothetical protein